MVILFAGIPGSGKSTLVNYLVKLSKVDLVVLQPELLYSSTADNTTKMAAWDTCIEQFKEEIYNIDSTIILDTCGSNKDVMIELANNSTKLGHKVIIAAMNTDSEICKVRNIDRKLTLSDSKITEYKHKLYEVIKLLRENYKVVVLNTNTKEDTKSSLKKILAVING